MIISNYKLCYTNCGNITLELHKSGFVLQQPITLHCRWLLCPAKQLCRQWTLYNMLPLVVKPV